jgi:putative holliday junction resolvase
MNDENIKRIMAIDYGKKRIGIALSDPLLTFAYPFQTLQNDTSFWNDFDKIFREKNISKILLGYPLKNDGTPYPNAAEVLIFKAKIAKKYNVEVLLRDEGYTSEMAKEIIIKTVNKKSKRREKGIMDRNAAAIILQEYLDEK